MEYFRKVLRAFGLFDAEKMDFVKDLPLEVSRIILSMLDEESLVNASRVSRGWLSICFSDRKLRARIGTYISTGRPFPHGIKRHPIRSRSTSVRAICVKEKEGRTLRGLGSREDAVTAANREKSSFCTNGTATRRSLRKRPATLRI